MQWPYPTMRNRNEENFVSDAFVYGRMDGGAIKDECLKVINEESL